MICAADGEITIGFTVMCQIM